MVTKNITITERAYRLLSQQKRPGESFSQVIEQHFQKRGKLRDYVGIWGDVSSTEWKELVEQIEHARKGITTSIRKRIGENSPQ